jgi:hypothetical protein
LSLSSGALVAAMAEGAASAHVPASLLSSTMETAVLVATGRTAVISSSVEVLMKGALKMMFLARLKLAVGAVVVVTTLGAAGLAYRATAEQPKHEPGDGAARVSRPAVDVLESLRLEIEELRRELRAIKERVQKLEAKAATPRDTLDKDLNAVRKRSEPQDIQAKAAAPRDTLDKELNALRKQIESQEAQAAEQAAAFATASRHMQRWQARMREGRSLLFEVRRVERDKEGHVETTRNGTLRINGPGRFCLELTEDGHAEKREKVIVGENAAHLFSFSRKEIVRFPIYPINEWYQWPTWLREMAPRLLLAGNGHFGFRPSKEDSHYIYLDISPEMRGGSSCEFRRGRLVIDKGSDLPRHLWLEQTGQETFWDLTKSQIGDKVDPKEFDNPHVPSGWRVLKPMP